MNYAEQLINEKLHMIVGDMANKIEEITFADDLSPEDKITVIQSHFIMAERNQTQFLCRLEEEGIITPCEHCGGIHVTEGIGESKESETSHPVPAWDEPTESHKSNDEQVSDETKNETPADEKDMNAGQMTIFDIINEVVIPAVDATILHPEDEPKMSRLILVEHAPEIAMSKNFMPTSVHTIPNGKLLEKLGVSFMKRPDGK